MRRARSPSLERRRLFDKIVRFIEEEADAELVGDFRDSIYYGDDSELAMAREIEEAS